MLTGSAPFCPPPSHPHRDSLCWKEMGIFFPSEFPSLADSSVAAESLRGARGGLRGGRQKAGPERPCPAPLGLYEGARMLPFGLLILAASLLWRGFSSHINCLGPREDGYFEQCVFYICHSFVA